MTVDAFALLVAIAVPVAALAALVGLVTSVRELERSRDELGELDAARR
jgi:hypothetical protein